MTRTPRALHPMGYFLTINTYGSWLPGDYRGWCRRNGGLARLPPSPALHARCVERLMHPRVTFNSSQIDVVHRSIVATCAHREWPLHALVVEGVHLHLVVSAPRAPEDVVKYLKSWATRALRRRGDFIDQPVWSEHGSTHYLHTRRDVESTLRYVCDDHHTPSGVPWQRG